MENNNELRQMIFDYLSDNLIIRLNERHYTDLSEHSYSLLLTGPSSNVLTEICESDRFTIDRD